MSSAHTFAPHHTNSTNARLTPKHRFDPWSLKLRVQYTDSENSCQITLKYRNMAPRNTLTKPTVYQWVERNDSTQIQLTIFLVTPQCTELHPKAEPQATTHRSIPENRFIPPHSYHTIPKLAPSTHTQPQIYKPTLHQTQRDT